MAESVVFGPYDRGLITDIIRFSDGQIDPFELADSLLRDWVERSVEDNPDVWDTIPSGDRSAEVAAKYAPEVYARWQQDEMKASEVQRAENRPLVWKGVTIRPGSEVRMTYGEKEYYAMVKNGRIHYEGKEYSPSRWACKIAGNTARNAWRDLWFREPMSKVWIPAILLRNQAREAVSNLSSPAPDQHDRG